MRESRSLGTVVGQRHKNDRLGLRRPARRGDVAKMGVFLFDRFRGSVSSVSSVVDDNEMALLIQNFTWKKTSLGPLQSWPDSLIQSVNLK
jgi:hypothetical protein